MKIQYVTSSFPRYNGPNGGLFIYNQIKYLVKNHEIHVVYPTKKRIFSNEFENLYLHEVNYPFRSYTITQLKVAEVFNLVKFSLQMLLKSRSVCKKNNVDIIHSHWAIPSGFLSSIHSSNIPKVITLHGSDLKVYAKKFPYRYLVKYAISNADKIIAVSNDLKDIAISYGCNPDKIAVIHNGVDIDLFKPRDKEEIRSSKNISSNFLITYVGNLVKVKRVDILIDICNDLSKVYDLDLLIVGEGPERTMLESHARNLGMSNINFQGTINHDEVPYYLSMSDVVALTSESEGLPTVLVEAMSCGVPAITMDIGGVKDIVKNGENGFVVNNKDEFKEKLEIYIEDDNLRMSFGKNARKLIEEEHSLEQIVFLLDELYSNLI